MESRWHIKTCYNIDTVEGGLMAQEERTHPMVEDPDGDGLDTIAELRYGTNPARDDTDMDGINDATELLWGGNPLLYDTDGDGVPDGLERRYGTDLRTPDWVPVFGTDMLGRNQIIGYRRPYIGEHWLMHPPYPSTFL